MQHLLPSHRKHPRSDVYIEAELGGPRASSANLRLCTKMLVVLKSKLDTGACMSSCWTGRIVALLGGLLAGSILDIGLLSMSYSTSTSVTYWEWWSHFPPQPHPDLLSYPIGAALAAFLGAVGLSRWRTTRSDILVVAVSSLIGAIVAVQGSLLFDCTYYGRWSMGCSGIGLLRLAFETPVVWIAFLAMTAVLALLARWIELSGSTRDVPADGVGPHSDVQLRR